MAEIVVEVVPSLCAEANVIGDKWEHPEGCEACYGTGFLDVTLVTLFGHTEATFERNAPWPDRG